MSIFQTIGNDKFFNPFCCRNRELYLECISLLIEKSKELPVLYELDAKSCILLELQNHMFSIETEDIGEEISNTRSAAENASAILRYFRECGWITSREVGRSGDNIAAVTSACRKLVEGLHRLFDRERNGAITNHIFAIYGILKDALGEERGRTIRPYSNLLVPLIEQECDLKNELFELRDNIRDIMRIVMQISDANSFGQFLVKDQVLEKFFNDYFFIKRSGLIPGYIAGIDRMLLQVRHSELYDRMVEEYQELKSLTRLEAQETIDRQFGELDSFVNIEYEKEMIYIDRKINTYYNLYSTRMMMVLSGSTNLQHELNRLLLTLKDLEPEGREALLGRLAESFQVQSMGYIGKKSLERRKKAQPQEPAPELLAGELSEEEKKALTDDLLKEAPDRYSLNKAADYYKTLSFPGGRLRTEDFPITTRDDAMMLAAGVIYSGTEGFPYRVELEEGLVETNIATLSKLSVYPIEETNPTKEK